MSDTPITDAIQREHTMFDREDGGPRWNISACNVLSAQLRQHERELTAANARIAELTAERDQWKNDAINGGNAGYLRDRIAELEAREPVIGELYVEESYPHWLVKVKITYSKFAFSSLVGTFPTEAEALKFIESCRPAGKKQEVVAWLGCRPDDGVAEFLSTSKPPLPTGHIMYPLTIATNPED